MLGIDQWVPKGHPKSLVLMSYSCYHKNIDHERYRYIEYNLEDVQCFFYCLTAPPPGILTRKKQSLQHRVRVSHTGEL